MATSRDPMQAKPRSRQPLQTTPKGAVIPVPTRTDFLSDLDKMVKAPPPKQRPKSEQKP
jgi:hypothetical protein